MRGICWLRGLCPESGIGNEDLIRNMPARALPGFCLCESCLGLEWPRGRLEGILAATAWLYLL